jgi:hypothetical protein
MCAAAQRGLVDDPALGVVALVHCTEVAAGDEGVDAHAEVGPFEGGGAGDPEDAGLAGG